jgi:hypothetical protein
MTAGLRADLYRFDVTASDPANSGRDVEALLSPKFGMVLGPWASTEFYVNGGFGFHSNDARGATITRDPITGEPAERVTPLARARGAEVGLRSVRLRGLQTTLSLWRLDLDSSCCMSETSGRQRRRRQPRATVSSLPTTRV